MRRQFKPPLTRPEDFEVFWESTWRQLQHTDTAIDRQAVDGGDDALITLETVSFESLGHVRVSAHCLSWRDNQPRPLVISSHGYGCRCEPRYDWARQGLNVLCVDIRGFGLSEGAISKPSQWGYVLTGIDTPETSAIRLAACDYMQAVVVAQQLFAGRTSSLVFEGVSFAGGLALMAQAVIGAADLLAIGVPTFGWAEGRNLFVKSGSGAEISNYLAHRPDRAEDTMVVLRYFDTVNFADRVSCPTLLALGLEDDVVPAKTVYGIANHLKVPFELMEFPVSHSDGPEDAQWEQFSRRWIDLACNGIPADFGRPAAS